MRSRLVPVGHLVLALALLVALTGCVGFYNNSDQFLNPPATGMKELEVLKTYGTPQFASESGGDRILSYKVRDTKYILLFGQYEGYDLIVVFKDGAVVETYKVQIPKVFCLFQPWNWVVTQ